MDPRATEARDQASDATEATTGSLNDTPLDRADPFGGGTVNPRAMEALDHALKAAGKYAGAVNYAPSFAAYALPVRPSITEAVAALVAEHGGAAEVSFEITNCLDEFELIDELFDWTWPSMQIWDRLRWPEVYERRCYTVDDEVATVLDALTRAVGDGALETRRIVRISGPRNDPAVLLLTGYIGETNLVITGPLGRVVLHRCWSD